MKSTTIAPTHPLVDGRTTTAPLMQALRGEQPKRKPIWFMRQAGRSLPEYRTARQGTGMLEACLRPDLASEITIQPVRRHEVDAAVFFSDIVVPLKLAGVGVDIAPGVGPVMDQPYRTSADIEQLISRTLDDSALDPIREAVALTTSELGSTPLIGFGGAPFTLAAYLVEGKPSRDHLAARTLMHADPATWDALVTWTADLTGAFLRAQVEAGASAVQLFDSWAGSLSLADYTSRVAASSTRALAHVAKSVPGVHFGTGTGHLLPAMQQVLVEAGFADYAVGVDYRTPLDEAAALLPGVPLQGNINPALLAAPWNVLEEHVKDVVSRGSEAPSHVVNLGHGVPPDTDPTVLTRVVELVHSL